MFGRDRETGERVCAEPRRAEKDRHGVLVLEQLVAVRAELGPLIEDVQAKTATARHTNPATEQWCDWVTRAAQELLAAASTWPWEPPYEDDNRLDGAVTDLRASAAALAAALRGEAPDPLPSRQPLRVQILQPPHLPRHAPDTSTSWNGAALTPTSKRTRTTRISGPKLPKPPAKSPPCHRYPP